MIAQTSLFQIIQEPSLSIGTNRAKRTKIILSVIAGTRRTIQLEQGIWCIGCAGIRRIAMGCDSTIVTRSAHQLLLTLPDIHGTIAAQPEGIMLSM
jgi:hypothetical protein